MIKKGIIMSMVMMLLISCDSKPKMIIEDSGTQSSAEGMVPIEAASSESNQSSGVDVHQVLAKEILQTDRYTYVKAQEGDRLYWVATSKMDAQPGKMYLYRGGLLKTNFESQEFDRVFDTIYLVSHIIDASEHPGGTMQGATMSQTSGSTPTANPIQMETPKDAVSLKDLFANKKKYEGQEITVAGECVKVNNGIMGRNWVHLQDGSKIDGKVIDLTVTTHMSIPLGSKVSLQGKVVLNKDFGAGYRYDLIVEGADAKRQ